MTTFLFPKDKTRRSQWIKAIPRKDWNPSATAVVCCEHFSDSDIIRFDNYLKEDGSLQQILLRRPRLKETAVPSIFPNLPYYLSVKNIQKRSDPEKRRVNLVKAHTNLVDNFLKNDLINSFEHLKNDYTHKVNLFSWESKISEKGIYFYTLNEENFLSIENSIHIDYNLNVHIFLKSSKLSYSDLKWILPFDLKLSRWSQLSNMLSRYKSISNEPKQLNINDLLNKSLFFLEEANKIADDVDFVYNKLVFATVFVSQKRLHFRKLCISVSIPFGLTGPLRSTDATLPRMTSRLVLEKAVVKLIV